jgi:hypothetical protein
MHGGELCSRGGSATILKESLCVGVTLRCGARKPALVMSEKEEISFTLSPCDFAQWLLTDNPIF